MAQIYWLNNRRSQDWKQKADAETGLTETELSNLRKIAQQQIESNR